jgi:acetyl esterase/lipase
MRLKLGFNDGGASTGYMPVAEPAPNAAMLAEYSSATEYTHDWSNLTGWTVSNMQVSSNRLYSNGSGTNPSAVYRPFAVAAGESARLTCEVVRVTGVNRAVYVGFETVGGAILASLPNFCGVGINGTDDFEAYIGANFTGVTTGSTILGNRAGSGTYTVTVTADPDYVSLVVRMADSSDEGRLVIPRSSLPGGGAIAGVAFWNTDTRGLTGSYTKGFGVRKSLTPFVTKTVTGAVIEGNSAQVIHRGMTADDLWRIHLPKNMDGTVAHPICLFTHQAATGTRNSVWDETRARPVLEALDAAGYIVISADDGGDRWGNQASIDNYLAAVQWVRDNFYAGPLVLWSPSMGGTPAWNIVLRRAAHVRAIAAICPVCDIPELYRDTFPTTINAAYGVTDLPGLETALASNGGFNPLDGNMVEFTGKGVKFWVGTGTTDTIVPEALHAVLMQSAIAPFAAESSLVETGTGHLAVEQYSAAGIVALFDAYT